MVLTYYDCRNKYGSAYQIKLQIKNGKLYKIEKGIYSDQKFNSENEIIMVKYPNAIYTMDSAFYYYNLTDTIPDHHYLATPRGTRKITDSRVKQIFENSSGFELGKTVMKRGNTEINIYSRERMLVELIRHKNSLPFDYYKEIIGNYRKILMELDIQEIQEVAYNLPKKDMVMQTLQLEVF